MLNLKQVPLNKSALQKINLLKKSSSRCIHTKNVYSLIDISNKDDFYLKVDQHIKGCQTCKDEFEKYKQKQFAIKFLIPKPSIDSETREIFENEVAEMFKSFDLNEKVLHKKKIKNKILLIDSFGSGVIKHVTSTKFYVIYVLGIGLYFILKNLVNGN